MIDWNDVPPGAGGPPSGSLGYGIDDVYQILTRDGQVTLLRVPEDWYRSDSAQLLIMQAAARTLITTGSVEEGRRIADRYEAGIDTPEHPAWTH